MLEYHTDGWAIMQNIVLRVSINMQAGKVKVLAVYQHVLFGCTWCCLPHQLCVFKRGNMLCKIWYRGSGRAYTGVMKSLTAMCSCLALFH